MTIMTIMTHDSEINKTPLLVHCNRGYLSIADLAISALTESPAPTLSAMNYILTPAAC